MAKTEFLSTHWTEISPSHVGDQAGQPVLPDRLLRRGAVPLSVDLERQPPLRADPLRGSPNHGQRRRRVKGRSESTFEAFRMEALVRGSRRSSQRPSWLSLPAGWAAASL